MVEAQVEIDYIAKKPEELTLKKGDIIKNVIHKSGGWSEGILHKKTGIFPDNCVKFLDKECVVLRNKRIRQCRATFSYNQDHEDELSLKVGDIIEITGEEEEGWWRGILNGKQGVFPSNFVEEIVTAPIRPKPPREDLMMIRQAETVPALPAKPVKQLCEARYSYEAENDDELSIKEGDIVTILSKDGQDPGWWKGELNGRIGVFPDNFVILLPHSSDEKKLSSNNNKVETKPITETSAIKTTSVASQRKSLEIKNTENKHSDTKVTPPLPGKKPLISIKKSPSGSGSGFLSKIKDKIVDAVDGATGSKTKENAKAENANNLGADIFDQVERRPLLNDLRANRARAPGRRLPTSVFKDEDDDDIPEQLPNGNAEHTSKSEYSIKSEDSFRSEGSVSSENLDFSSDMEANENKPKLREWEKHKAPWLEEMKLNQAKRTSVSPSPELKPKIPQSVVERKHVDTEVSKSNQNSPAEKEINLAVDMSKSMNDMKLSPMELKPIPKPHKTPLNELDKTPAIIKSSIPRESPTKTLMSSSQPLKASPKSKTELYENTIIQKPISRTTTVSNTNISINDTSISHMVEKTSSITVNSSESSNASKLNEFSSIIDIDKFNKVLERLTILELKCEKHEQTIEDLKNRLKLETEMRMLLQEKVMQISNVQV